MNMESEDLLLKLQGELKERDAKIHNLERELEDMKTAAALKQSMIDEMKKALDEVREGDSGNNKIYLFRHIEDLEIIRELVRRDLLGEGTDD